MQTRASVKAPVFEAIATMNPNDIVPPSQPNRLALRFFRRNDKQRGNVRHFE